MLLHQNRTFVCESSVILALFAIAACSDSSPVTPAPPPPAISITGLPPSNSILHQLEVSFAIVADSPTAMGTFAVTFDGNPAPTRGNDYVGEYIIESGPLSNGTHTAHIIVTPASGDRGLDTTFSFTIQVDAKSYLSTIVPPLPGGADASAVDMNSLGVIVGTSQAADTLAHAVTWINGEVAELPGQGGLQTEANAINTEGDIAGTLDSSPFASAALWLPGDTLKVIGTEQTAVGINDKGQVLLSWGSSRAPVALYDIASNSTTDLWTNTAGVDLNESGQAVGYGNPPPGFGYAVATSGLSLPTIVPEGLRDHSNTQPVDLNDKGDMLLDANGWWVFGSGSSAEFLNDYLGGAPQVATYAARINNRGEVVALVHGALYHWDTASRITRRINAGTNWTFDRITYLGDDGTILAHGVNAQSGEKAALLLRPAA